MKAFPHRYTITARSATAGNVRLGGERLPDLESASPAEFGGPGDQWSPETLLVAAVGDCFIMTFRAVAADLETEAATSKRRTFQARVKQRRRAPV